LLIVSVIGFAIIQSTGDPLAAYTVDSSLTSADIARLQHQYGLDRPLPIQYLNWLKNMLTGNWGTSYSTRQSVVSMVWASFPHTLLLAGLSYLVILSVALVLGVVTAVRQYSVL